jgi:hypothetical protein
MVKDHKFWVGFIAGIVAYLLYVKFASKKLGGGQAG